MQLHYLVLSLMVSLARGVLQRSTLQLTVTVTTLVTPTFDPITLCQNSTATALPGSSLNGIAGTWSPATINTATPGTTTYTFTPTDACATTASISVVITTLVTPTFDPVGPFCQNSTPTALPLISNNGVNGTWSPATINTSVAGSSTYTFTPTDACATTASISVVITTLVTPTFDPITLCQNSTATALPGTSNNGIAGTWSPATINTSVAGSSTYTFTPTDACATTAQLTVTVTTLVTPTFDPITLCKNSTSTALTDTSNNGIAGTWSPATINTSFAYSSTYTFTPTDASPTTPHPTPTFTTLVTPTFDPITLCQNSTATALPGTSLNGIA